MLKIRTICYALELWKLAQSCKQLCLLCPPDPWNFPGTALLMDFKAPGSFEIHWVRQYLVNVVIPPTQQSCWGCILVSLRPSVRPSHIPCPLCSAYSSDWIHFIFIHLIKQLQKVCHVGSFVQNFKIWIFGNFLKFVTVLCLVLILFGIKDL